MEEDDDEEDSNQEKPTEELIEEMEEKLDQAQSELKNLFLIIFQVHNYADCFPRLYTKIPFFFT